MKLRYKITGGLLAVLVLAVAVFAVLISRTEVCGPADYADATGESMKAFRFRCYGSPEVLELVELDRPAPGDGELLVRVKAAAVNPLDWHYMRGSPYIMRLQSGLGAPKDTRLGVDFAGTVEAVGAGVTRFKPGDRVFGSRSGAFAEYLVVPQDRAVAAIPEGVSFEQAAAVTVAAITALQALRDKGGLQAGEEVLINGASGGVGSYAVQIAKAMGAEVTGVSSARNHEMVRSLGADRMIDYRSEDYSEGEDRYDLIVDMVGNHSPLANRGVLKPGGRLVLVGGESGDWIGPLKRPLQAMVVSMFVDEKMVTFVARLRQEDLEFLAGLMASGEMKSVIDRRFKLAEVPEAVAYSESGRARGKIIVLPEE